MGWLILKISGMHEEHQLPSCFPLLDFLSLFEGGGWVEFVVFEGVPVGELGFRWGKAINQNWHKSKMLGDI
jgi:hypothetical protein